MKSIIFVLLVLFVLACQNGNNKPIQPIGSGSIRTVVDGYDVQRVNLWDSSISKNKVNGYLTNGQRVKILRDEHPYFLVQSSSNSELQGYCLKDFIILEN